MRHVCVSVVIATAALAGCSAPRDIRAVYEPTADMTSSSTPMAEISPSAGEVVSVLLSRVDGVMTQRIVLKGDPRTGGENYILVKVDQGVRPSSLSGPVPKPTESMILDELQSEFAGSEMNISQSWNRNSFGPFGYAIGHPSTGSTCVYAWQYQHERVMPLVGSPALATSSASLPTWQTSIRVRICKTGVGESEIVAWLRDLVVYAPDSHEAYQDPAYNAVGPTGSRDSLSAAGIPGGMFLAAKPTRASAPTADVEEPAPRRHHRMVHARMYSPPRHRRHAAVARYEPESEPRVLEGPVVPLPGGGSATAAAPAPTASASNPLLAPLQESPAPRPVARGPSMSSDMPLPPRASSRAAPASQPALGTMPLPN